MVIGRKLLISDVKVPKEATVKIQPFVLTQHPNLAVIVALIIASWAETEARLDSIFLALTKDEARLAQFKELKGWDRRVEYMSAALKDTAGERAAATVRAVLNVVSKAAKKRNEVAHGLWAICEGEPSQLALFTSDAYTHATRSAIEAEAVGSARMNSPHEIFFSKARIVNEIHLQKAWEECEESRNLLHSFWTDELPEIVKVNRHIPAAKAIEHIEVAERIKNAERDIRRREKEDAKKQRADRSVD
ncbi:hypothetical protein [Sphingobium baderi]|uniref:Uncharacterized protein n=1 Tax=Sphingobium baderi TaxID=1332080 RepID=A0A0S3F2T0_9SPHN|nr:hypothetical protein [Sphingobium baderi]ALR21885.1 hypothetical protein ATN00_17905 [Sphingobium baderi]